MAGSGSASRRGDGAGVRGQAGVKGPQRLGSASTMGVLPPARDAEDLEGA
jgi:hypothetical protein